MNVNLLFNLPWRLFYSVYMYWVCWIGFLGIGMSRSFKSVWGNACAHTLHLGLYCHLKELLGVESKSVSSKQLLPPPPQSPSRTLLRRIKPAMLHALRKFGSTRPLHTNKTCALNMAEFVIAPRFARSSHACLKNWHSTGMPVRFLVL